MSQRIYTEKEVAVLLERAAEMQAQFVRRTEHKPGLTLEELESVASEAVLDPSLLQKAAAELDQSQHALLSRNSGMTSAHVFIERRVSGMLTPELWEDVVAEMRHHFDSDLGSMMGMPQYGVGTTEQIGRTLEWRHTSMSGIETKLMIRPKEDELNVRMSQRVGWASPLAEGSGYGLILALIASVIAGVVASSVAIGVAVFLLTLLAAVPLIIYADGAWRRKKLRELESLTDRISSIVAAPVNEIDASDEQVAERSIQTAARPPATPRIDASVLEDESNPTRDPSRSRRRSRGA